MILKSVLINIKLNRTTMFRNIASLFLLTLAVFVNADVHEQLVGGNDSQLGQFPYTAYMKLNGKPFCGGAIISKYHIITAAHCILSANNKVEDVEVVTGTIFLDQGGDTHRVAGLYPHPYYPDYINKDVGVIKLANPINFNANQQPIGLPKDRTPAFVSGIVSGWGGTSSPPTAMSNSQQHLSVKVIDTMICRQSSGFIISEICTLNGPGSGTCTGDSGDPFVYNNAIAGIASRGLPCARGKPDIFTSVYDSLEFIEKAMGY